MTNTSSEINALVEAYYKSYYHDQLGLPDWQRRVEARLNETEVFTIPKVEKFQRWFNVHLDSKWRILVLGAGTGAEFLYFASLGCDVYGIEPDADACKIGKLKAEQAGIDPDRFMQGIGEDMPYADNEFDLVWCHTVIEHVQNVEDTLSELIRVIKPNGYGYIVTPDYRQWYEPHYKLPIPMFMPKVLIKAYLAMIGRPPQFIDTLQFVTKHQLSNFFQDHDVEAFHVYHPWVDTWKTNPSRDQRLIMLLSWLFGWQRDQYWVLRKPSS